MRRSLVIAALILAACGGNSETTTTTAAPLLTTLPDIAEPEPSSTTTTETPPATTSTTTTTTTLPPNAAPDFGLTQIVFGEAAFVVITNWGNATGSLDGFWLCQPPSDESLPDVELRSGEQAVIGLAGTPPPELAGMAEVVDIGPVLGELDPTGGEIALYLGSGCDDPESIVAYVQWGEPGHQGAEIAVAAGIWDGGAVTVFDEAPSISSGVHPATQSSDWSADVGG
jgi:hypothetical protein